MEELVSILSKNTTSKPSFRISLRHSSFSLPIKPRKPMAHLIEIRLVQRPAPIHILRLRRHIPRRQQLILQPHIPDLRVQHTVAPRLHGGWVHRSARHSQRRRRRLMHHALIKRRRRPWHNLPHRLGHLTTPPPLRASNRPQTLPMSQPCAHDTPALLRAIIHDHSRVRPRENVTTLAKNGILDGLSAGQFTFLVTAVGVRHALSFGDAAVESFDEALVELCGEGFEGGGVGDFVAEGELELLEGDEVVGGELKVFNDRSEFCGRLAWEWKFC